MVAIPHGTVLDRDGRRALLHDVGDLVADLGGTYATGPDTGTGPEDMTTIAERTEHVFCRPPEAGGSGDSSIHTAAGVLAALRAVCDALVGPPELAECSFAIIGLGRVGTQLAHYLADEGAKLFLSDIDASKRTLADEFSATWLEPQDALQVEVDILVPAALGGVLTAATVPLLRCAAIAGPADNQLDQPETAELLHRKDILWAPDYVVSAGGVIHATSVELGHETTEQASRRVAQIGDTVAQLLRDARRTGRSPADVARDLVHQRLQRPGT